MFGQMGWFPKENIKPQTMQNAIAKQNRNNPQHNPKNNPNNQMDETYGLHDGAFRAQTWAKWVATQTKTKKLHMVGGGGACHKIAVIKPHDDGLTFCWHEIMSTTQKIMSNNLHPKRCANNWNEYKHECAHKCQRCICNR